MKKQNAPSEKLMKPKSTPQKKTGNWRFKTTLDHATTVQLAEATIQQQIAFSDIFKNDHKCLVARFKDSSLPHHCLLKIPRARFSRYWERFLTFFRPGETFRQFEQLENLKQLGFKGPSPLIAGEKRRYGVVVDGFIIYQYICGRQGTADDTHLITPELLRLHHLGYTRKDPTPRNFIISGEDIYFIDFNLKKPWIFNRILCLMEYCKHLEGAPKAIMFQSQATSSAPLFKTACILQCTLSSLRRLRRQLKKASLKTVQRRNHD